MGVLSINDEDIEQLSIYPNPNNGLFTLDFGTQVPEDVFISNTLGEIIFLNSQVKPIETVDLSDVAAGVYFVIYQLDGMKQVNKLVIQQ